MTKPTTYEIALRGNVGVRSLRPLADDFSVTESEPGITRLVGIIRDSSQMHGLVAHLASMGVDIVSIVATESTTKEAAAMAYPTQTMSQAHELTDRERLEAARRYVQQLQAFYVHAGVFAAGMLIIFVVNLATNVSAGIADDWWAWWSIWAFIGWGSGIAIHGLVVRLNRPSPSGPSSEDRLIDKELSR